MRIDKCSTHVSYRKVYEGVALQLIIEVADFWWAIFAGRLLRGDFVWPTFGEHPLNSVLLYKLQS
jgi:hypothetical protein